MCVTVAMKLPRDKKTGKPTKDAKWRLAKIRDRIYDANYMVKRYTVAEHGASQLFLIDTETDWTEGVSVLENGSYLSMVNSALNNHSDKKDGKGKGSGKNEVNNKPISSNGKVIRKSLKCKHIKDAVELIKEEKFDGCTLITDGDQLFIIETSLSQETADKYRDQVTDGKRFEDVVPPEEFNTEVLEIKEDYLVVRTNSGVLDDSFGYQPKDGDGHTSAQKRRDYAMEILDKNAYEPLDLIVSMSRMGRPEIDKNPFFRPLRLKDEVPAMDDAGTKIYTTSIIQTDPSGTMIVKPIECSFDINNAQNLISAKYKTHLVILPHRSRMFESFTGVVQKTELEQKLA
jgi:hypothetical protein